MCRYSPLHTFRKVQYLTRRAWSVCENNHKRAWQSGPAVGRRRWRTRTPRYHLAPKQPKRSELTQSDRDYRYRAHRITTIANVLVVAIRFGAPVAIAYFGYRSVEALAGRTTLADIGISLLGKVQVSVVLSWAVGAGGVLYGNREHRLRLKVNEAAWQACLLDWSSKSSRSVRPVS